MLKGEKHCRMAISVKARVLTKAEKECCSSPVIHLRNALATDDTRLIQRSVCLYLCNERVCVFLPLAVFFPLKKVTRKLFSFFLGGGALKT